MTHRILLADDSVTIRKVVELTFSDEDFTIDSVGDGSQAFEHARAQRPDIIISDVIMPGFNGYELCQKIKADPDLQSVPFLFLKGTFESFDEEKARSCGADGFIVKPFESQEMIAKVKNLIEMAAVPVRPVSTPASLQTPVAPRPIPPLQTAAAIPPAAPRPGFVPPRPAPLQRDAVTSPSPFQRLVTTPPPIPTMHARAAPTPPAMPVMPARAAPPIPQRPIRPVAFSPPAPLPTLQPAPPIIRSPPPPPPPAAAQAPSDDFGFDFGESEGDHFGALATQPAVRKVAVSPLEPSEESDEDLWSEVSLRGSTGDLLGARSPAGFGAGSGADIVELAEETAIDAPEVLFEDETVFEEVATARRTPHVPTEPEATRPPLVVPVAPPLAREETPATTALEPSSAEAPSAPISIDQAEIERIVTSRVEAAVRQILEPIVRDLARSMIESVAWEVIPDLAEAMIRAEIERVRQSAHTD